MSLRSSSVCSFPSAELLMMNDVFEHTEEVEEEEMQSRGATKRNGCTANQAGKDGPGEGEWGDLSRKLATWLAQNR